MKDGKLAGKAALVTGASKGIGAAIAKALAAEGAAVVVNYASSKADGDKVVKEIAAGGGKAVALQANLSKKPDVERLFAETKKAFGRLDILVNNAGISGSAVGDHDSLEGWQKLLYMNAISRFLKDAPAVDVHIVTQEPD